MLSTLYFTEKSCEREGNGWAGQKPFLGWLNEIFIYRYWICIMLEYMFVTRMYTCIFIGRQKITRTIILAYILFNKHINQNLFDNRLEKKYRALT